MVKTLGTRISLTFVAIAAASLLALITFYTHSQQTQIIAHNEQAMTKVTESVSEGLQAVMLGGYADIAQSYAANLQGVQGIIDFRILRVDGQEAFLDNNTIEKVNALKKEEIFFPRDEEIVHQILPVDHVELRLAVSDKKTSKYYTEDEKGGRILSFITPIENKKDCWDCHGSEPPVRGVLKLTTSLAAVDKQIADTRRDALKISLASIIIIILFTFVTVRRTVVAPIMKITDAMKRISDGDLKQKIPDFTSEELQTMAESFNQMSQELQDTYSGLKQEHDKITTLILSTKEGMVVTDKRGRIVLTNPAVETILGKSQDEIIMAGFLHLVDNPEVIRNQLNAKPGDDKPDQLEYRGLTLQLNASTIFSETGTQIGTAALIRDVTEEVRLNKELEKLSTSDALTGLYNRRFLDNRLQIETHRSKRYSAELSIIIFDVDHFKKFNDEHGHSQGDRVLQSIGATLMDAVRDLDLPCRYGGEEFLVILPETSLEGAHKIAERLRVIVENTEVDGMSVTISLGVASTNKGKLDNPSKLIEIADKALYNAKEDGRNRVTLAPLP